MKNLRKQQKPKPIGLSDRYRNLRNLNVLTLLLLTVYNTIHYVLYSTDTTQYLLTTLSFVVYGLTLVLIRSKLIFYIIYLLVGSVTVLLAERSIEYSGVIYFLFAAGLYPKSKYLITCFITAFIFLSIRLSIVSEKIPITIQMLLLFVFISITAYIIFFKKPKRHVDIWDKISNKERSILKLYIKGYDYATISHKLKIDDKKESIRSAITRCRNLAECSNDMEFAIWLNEIG